LAQAFRYKIIFVHARFCLLNNQTPSLVLYMIPRGRKTAWCQHELLPPTGVYDYRQFC